MSSLPRGRLRNKQEVWETVLRWPGDLRPGCTSKRTPQTFHSQARCPETLAKYPAAEVNGGQGKSRNLKGAAAVAAAFLWLIQSPATLKGYQKITFEQPEWGICLGPRITNYSDHICFCFDFPPIIYLWKVLNSFIAFSHSFIKYSLTSHIPGMLACGCLSLGLLQWLLYIRNWITMILENRPICKSKDNKDIHNDLGTKPGVVVSHQTPQKCDRNLHGGLGTEQNSGTITSTLIIIIFNILFSFSLWVTFLRLTSSFYPNSVNQRFIQQSPLSVGNHSKTPQWMSKTVQSAKPYTCYVFSYIYVTSHLKKVLYGFFLAYPNSLFLHFGVIIK